MKIRLAILTVCALSLSAVCAWAALPVHNGNTNPATEGFLVDGNAAYGGPDSGATGWTITDPGTGTEPNGHLLYWQPYVPSDFPTSGSWSLNWTVSMTAASTPGRPTVCVSDGSKNIRYQFSISPAGVGTIYMINSEGADVPVATFVNGSCFHRWNAVCVGGYIDLYMDGMHMASTKYSDYLDYPGFQMFFGTLNPGPACVTKWSEFQLVALPAPGDLTGNITLDGYSGDKSLAPVKIEFMQGGVVQWESLVTLGAG